MANVDPFVIRWPKKWESDPELRDVLRYLNRFLHDLWIRTGGGPDLIEEGLEAIEDLQDQINAIIVRLDANEAAIADLQARVEYLEGTTVVTAVDVTAEGNQVIICTDAVTVTLALSPLDKDVVEVKRTNGLVTVAGNGNTIDGSSEITLTRDFIGYSMEYSSTADAWFIL